MKMTHCIPGLLIALSLNVLSSQAQDQSQSDSTGLPGDNFSLQGALSLFKKANSPEEFEKLLNTESQQVNNLDLNEDGNIDYIRVINKKENDVQIFVLQALVSDKESQDIAVIELEKTGKDNAVIEITGDEDIFGEEVIIEPSEEDNAYNVTGSSIARGPNMEYDGAEQAAAVVVNVWAWPCVRFVYAPAYRVYVSPWSWYARPTWWRPWRPLAWHAYHPIRYRYRPHYVVVHTHRVAYAPRLYRPMRVTSVTVTTRHKTTVTHYRASRTTRTVNAAHGNKQYRATRKTTTVEGPRGNKVSRTRTTVRKRG
jgi:hypothetical protein